ncbi:MAG: hypothetical protein ACE5JA_01100 [bacterium]
MWRLWEAVTVFLVFASCGVAMAQVPITSGSNTSLSTYSSWFDSLNVRFVANWPFGHANAVACDETRDILFCRETV